MMGSDEKAMYHPDDFSLYADLVHCRTGSLEIINPTAMRGNETVIRKDRQVITQFIRAGLYLSDEPIR